MPTRKNFFHDRSALLLISGNVFLTILAVVLILLKLNLSKGTDNFIVSYRANLGLSAYKTGTLWDILSFIGFAVVVFVISVVLAHRTYAVKRELSLTILALALPLLLFLIVVTNALLVLR